MERHVRLTEEHRARLEHTVYDKGVTLRDVALVLRVAPRRRLTGDVIGLLDRHGHAVQRASRAARPVERFGAQARTVKIAHDDRIERAVVFLDARQIEIEQLKAADLFGSDCGRELRSGAEGKIEHRLNCLRDAPPIRRGKTADQAYYSTTIRKHHWTLATRS